MANPHQQSPHGDYDPAGSTQMFRAFVDDSGTGAGAGVPATGGRRAAAASRAGGRSRAGVILGVIVAIAVVAGAAWLAFS